MLSNHIESHLLGLHDIKLKSIVGRRGIKSIWPPSLIKRSELEQDFIIERKPLVLIQGSILHHGNLTHCSIALDCVQNLSTPENTYLDTIEIRGIRRPCLHVRNSNYSPSSFNNCLSNNLLGRKFGTVSESSFKKFHLHDITFCSLSCDLNLHRRIVNVADHIVAVYMNWIYRFHPYSLPYSADRSIPDSGRSIDLLSARLESVVSSILNLY